MTRTDTPSWLQELPGERARLVRLCARLTGNYDAAEDLAQEALFEAWRQAPNLRDVASWRAFVTGIARNVCLRWRREKGREALFRAVDGERYGVDAYSILLDTTIAAPFDMEGSLEQAEISELLDKAMAQLPPSARELLTERYVEDVSPTEMAERHGVTDNVLGVRLHRARVSLQRLLATAAFREDAASYGLISSESADGWQETRLWCPRCGNHHLQGRFAPPEEAGENSAQTPAFEVRCPDCERSLGRDFTSAHPGLPIERVLGPVRGFKPALNRLSGWWHSYYLGGLRKGRLACPVCGTEAGMTTTPPIGTHPLLAALRGAYISCRRCAFPICVSPSGLAFHAPAVQRFWKEHPRMALTEERDVRYQGAEAVAVMFRSLTDTAALEVVLSRTNFETLYVSLGTGRRGKNRGDEE